MIGLAANPAFAETLDGQVHGGGQPIANSTVTLWAAGAGAPQQLAQARTDAEGRFVFASANAPGADASLYLVAKGGHSAADKADGDNPALALLTVLGNKPPAHVTINEMTTVASVWTHAQFIDGGGIKGHALGLRIAAGNVPNFVDLPSGGYGVMIQSDLNSTQTPTMANFATLSSVLAGCATRVKPDACSSLFAAATGRDGVAPADTLASAIFIAHDMGYKPDRVFALLDAFYPVPKGKNLRATPFMPYLSVAPSAWVMPLKFTGGGYTRRRQGDVRQQGQRLERRQFHRRLAGTGCAVGRQYVGLRARRTPAFADHHRLRGRRLAGSRLRHGDRRQ